MKTSMAYRLYRLYFNSNSDNYQLFGNRVYNPLNGQTDQSGQFSASLIRALLIVAAVGTLMAIIAF